MTNVIASAPPVDQSRPSERSWLPLVSVALALGALWLICFRHLSAEWSYNEQYSYGWFVPFFALYLFWLRWEDAPALQPPEIRNQEPEVSGQRSEVAAVDLNRHHSTLIATFAIAALFLLLPIRLIEIANPDWRPISWIHTLAAVSLTLFVIWRAGGKPWLRHFAFPVVFVLVSVPWISAIEIPIVQGLMPTLASIATEALSLFGIPAEVQGNLVRINGVIVGVNEACSGVRSLQTSLMIGLLFGELKRLGLVKRIALVIGAIAIAFVANCARAFFLVWIAATRGLTEVEKWHDVAGYTIVGLVFFGCLGITALLARGEVAAIDPNRHLKKISDEPGSGNPPAEVRNPNFNFLNSKFYFVALVWLLLVEFGVEWWYRAHETNLPRTVQWSVQWPKAAPDFRDLPIDERTRAILHFDKGRGATWRKPDDASPRIAVCQAGVPAPTSEQPEVQLRDITP
jgi:exosortase